MNKKIAVMLSLMVVAIISVGFVCASDDDTVTVNGLDFNIPDGYSVDNSSSDSAVLKNTEGDEISIDVETTLFDELNLYGDEATYGSHEGILRSFTDGNYTFYYLDSNKKVTITASDPSLIESLFD